MSGDNVKLLLDVLSSITLFVHMAVFAIWCALSWYLRRESKALRLKNEAEHAERMAAIADLKADIRRFERKAGIPPQLTLVKKDGP